MFQIENSIGFLLAKAYQRGWSLFMEDLNRYGLTPPQFSVLAFLWQQDGLTQTELSEQTQIDRTTLGGMIDRLERMELVVRKRHPHDRRAHLVFLATKGTQLQPELTQIAATALERFTSDLTEADKQHLTRILHILRGERETYAQPAP